MIENYVEITENCRHNLMFRHVCPVGNITRLETLTPHGWAQLIALERRGLSTWNPDTVDALYSCADCGSCRAHSVYDQALPAAIAKAREDVVEQGKAPAVVQELEKKLREYENPYVEQRPEAASGKGDVALFVGDEAQHLKPAALQAALKLLKAVGVEPVLIGKGRSNGYIATSLGLHKVAKKLAEANQKELKATGAKRLFVLTPGDYFALGQMSDERLGVTLPEGVELIEVVPFLAERMDAGALKLKQASGASNYAYVDPTHSVRVKTRYPAPRKLLKAVLKEPAGELFWREDRAYPCGNLALQFTQPKIADGLTIARLTDAGRTGAETVVTEDPGSQAHLERHAKAFTMRVQGLYELLADHIA
jgi:Fe-S oxidoreductase